MSSPAASAKEQKGRAGFLPDRVVHLHASKFCNLACKHCYSSSGPAHRGGLDPAVVRETLARLREEGYDVLSLSGGEPLLYAGIEEIIREARKLDYQVNLVSNGAPIGGRHLDLIDEHIALTAISLDGGPETHIELRGHDRAFAWAERAVSRLADAGARFGIVYCLSRASLAEMPWAVEWARSQGAGLVQFHPFSAVGRGADIEEELSLSPADQARAYMIATLLSREEAPDVHVDLAHIEAVLAQQSRYSILGLDQAKNELLADLVNPLIIEESGQILPFSYGVDPNFAIGQAGPHFGSDITRFKAEGWHEVRELLHAAFSELSQRESAFVDWFYHLVQVSVDLAEDGRTVETEGPGALGEHRHAS